MIKLKKNKQYHLLKKARTRQTKYVSKYHKEQLKEFQPQIRKLHVCWNVKFYLRLVRPCALENATLLNINEKCYIYGGKYKVAPKKIGVLDLYRRKWNYLQPTRMDPIWKRAGHSCSKITNYSFVIFGGQKIEKMENEQS